ncbi:DsbA family oxidoreductase [Nocardioides rubriscoriae]|uniref:DsbA family oxidoreductase n=1 Tax=Nocardioides rubriscoriae TaxID=642762 RepID=UPI0011DF2D84|nr:DsbA family oxidoreductase [Nocardioides rubriscoriae]
MRIEIWSDVVCPWCYIGKRRLEEALAGFEHRDEVEVVWRSFQLDPSAPTEPSENVAEAIGRKYGGGAGQARQMMAQVQQVAAEVGLDFTRHADALHLSTVDAHRLLHAAGDLRGELKEALLHAYFVEARNVADHDVLVEVAASMGLDPDRARAVLTSDAHADDVAADVAQAAAYGATGVPFFVVDARYGVSGAQPTEVFSRLLEQAWAERSPITMVSAGGTAPGCEGDECAI